MHFTKNKISNSYNIIAMGDEKWEGEYLKELLGELKNMRKLRNLPKRN